MRDVLIFMLVFGSLPFILRRPHIGILVWSWLAFMSPHRLSWGIAYDFQFSAVVALVLLISVAISDEPKEMTWNSVTVVWLVFFLWTVLSTLVAIFPEEAAFEWSRWWKINLVSLIMLLVMGSRERLHLLVWVIACSLGFYGVKGGIFAITTGGQYMVIGPPGSFIDDNTSLGLALIMTVPLMRYLQLTAEKFWIKWGMVGAMGLTALAIVSTQSRGAFLGVAGMAAFMLIKTRNWFRFGLALLILIPVLFTFMPDSWFNRMETIQTYEEDGSALGRINAWWFAFNLAKDRPLTGGGFGAFTPKLFNKYAPDPEDFHDAHSIYFEVLGEQGFFGLALFLLLGILTYRLASKIIRKTRRRTDLAWANQLAAMIQVALVGYAICGAFLGHAYFDFLYALVAIIVLTSKVVEKELAGRAQEQTDPVAKSPAPLSGHRVQGRP